MNTKLYSSAIFSITGLLCISAQSLVVAQVGLAIPFLALMLLLIFLLCLERQHHTNITIGMLVITSIGIILLLMVLVVWVRDTIVLAETSFEADHPILAKVDKTLFPKPSVSLLGCNVHTTKGYWHDLTMACRIGHVCHGCLVMLTLIASLVLGILSLVLLAKRDRRRNSEDNNIFAAFNDGSTVNTIENP